MTISPLILGTGRAGQAIEKSLAMLALQRPELGLQPATRLARGAKLASIAREHDNPVMIVANPTGLHASAILEADAVGVSAIFCEKPSCVSLTEAASLRGVRTPTAVFHVYRQTWGAQTLKRMLDAGELGQLISIEGRYWQSSAAEHALQVSAGAPAVSSSWKNNRVLNGPADTLLDIATHWADLACHLQGSLPSRIQSWRSFLNAETSHRDSHVQLAMDFNPQGRAFGSISKAVHGATNHFEINLLGTLASATWNFLSPDEIVVGKGRDRQVVTRQTTEYGSQQSPFHALGWLEGYIEILSQALGEVFLGKPGNFPRLTENLDLIEKLLQAFPDGI